MRCWPASFPTLSIMHVIWGYVALKRNFVTGSHCTHLATKINGENGSRDPQILKLWVLDGSDRLASSSGWLTTKEIAPVSILQRVLTLNWALQSVGRQPMSSALRLMWLSTAQLTELWCPLYGWCDSVLRSWLNYQLLCSNAATLAAGVPVKEAAWTLGPKRR